MYTIDFSKAFPLYNQRLEYPFNYGILLGIPILKHMQYLPHIKSRPNIGELISGGFIISNFQFLRKPRFG